MQIYLNCEHVVCTRILTLILHSLVSLFEDLDFSSFNSLLHKTSSNDPDA